MAALRTGNLALKFGVELVAIASLGYWGASLDGALLSAVMAVLAPATVIAVWGRLAAPNARQRLRLSARVPLELTLLLGGALAVLAAGDDALAVIIATAVVLNALLLSAFGQWEA